MALQSNAPTSKPPATSAARRLPLLIARQSNGALRHQAAMPHARRRWHCNRTHQPASRQHIRCPPTAAADRTAIECALPWRQHAATACASQLADGTAIERTNQQAASLAAASCQHLRGTLMAITRYSHSSAHQSPSTRSRCARATPLAAAAVAPALAGIQALFELLVVAAYPSAAAAAARRRQSQSTHSRCSRRM